MTSTSFIPNEMDMKRWQQSCAHWQRRRVMGRFTKTVLAVASTLALTAAPAFAQHRGVGHSGGGSRGGGRSSGRSAGVYRGGVSGGARVYRGGGRVYSGGRVYGGA